MRELVVPPLATIPDTGGLADLVFRNADEAPGDVVLSRKVGASWRDVTAERFRDEVLEVAKGLIATGIGAGERVGILSATRYEWTLLDFAIWAAGAVSVPIYATSSAEQMEWILTDSGAVAVVVETAEHEAKLAEVVDRLPELRHTWRLDGGTEDGDGDGDGKSAIETLVEAGREVEDAAVHERRDAVRPDEVATIIYTSGTTGRPKGCVLTHKNFFAAGGNAVELLHPLFKGDAGEGATTLLFLPIAHVFGRIVEVGAVMARATLGHHGDVKTLAANLAEYRPTFLLSVPYVLEKVYNSARQKAHSEGKGRIFDAAVSTAIAYSEAGARAGIGLKIKHAVFDKLVYSKLRAALGGRVRYVISGGAALGLRLTHFYRGVGITVFEGYGLTETTAPAAVNSPVKFKAGTVGRPLPGTSIRVNEDNEILVRGDNVFGSYWKNETATSDAIDADGWFYTGDLGDIDEDGYLRITGRKKEILVTSGGKNVAPAVIEDRVGAHPLVGQAMVVGDGRKYVAALVTIDLEYFGYWKTTAGKAEGATVGDLIDDADLHGEIQKAVDDGNAAVSEAEAVRKFRILDTEFNPENGYLTPSLKLKRNVIMKDFAGEVEALYR